MIVALATLQQFLDRVDDELTLDLTIGRKVDEANPATVEELAKRNTSCETALEDASAKILGYRPLIASSLWPDADTQRTHCCEIALHKLTGRRVGNEYKAIREAHDAAIAFYEKLAERTSALGEASATHAAPPLAFTDRTLKGFTS